MLRIATISQLIEHKKGIRGAEQLRFIYAQFLKRADCVGSWGFPPVPQRSLAPVMETENAVQIESTRRGNLSAAPRNPLQFRRNWGIVGLQHRQCLVCRWCVHLRTRGGSCRSRLAAVFFFHLLLYSFSPKKSN